MSSTASSAFPVEVSMIEALTDAPSRASVPSDSRVDPKRSSAPPR
ncbi:hypothetical protein P9139_03700 [Curtobacterium flaccumfaciens]|nr:hypothetical protein P9139_03700 [Curtobacterium flaccumfaciens]